MPSKGLHFGWVVLAATFYLNLVVDGYCFVFGIIRIFIEADYPTYPAWMVAIIGGLVPAIYLTFAPVCMAINDFLGPTRVIITASLISTIAFILAWWNLFWRIGFWYDMLMLGILQGISSALLYGPSIAVVAQYFPPHQRSLAAGITTCGSPVGAMFYALIIPPLFEAFGWRGSLAIFAGFNLNGCLCAMAFLESLKPKKEKPRHNHPLNQSGGPVKNIEEQIALSSMPPNYLLTPALSTDEEVDPDNLRIVKEKDVYPECLACEEQQLSHISHPKRTFVAVLKTYFNAKLVFQLSFLSLLLAAAFSIVGYYIPTLLVNAQAKRQGISQFVQDNLLFVWGVFNTIGRAVSGKLGDLGTRFAICTSFWIFIIGNAISAILLLVFPGVMHMGASAFIGFMITYGIFIAPLVTMRSVIVSDMYGEENASASFGWFLAVQGVVQLIGFILPTFLDAMSAMYAYSFGAFCFLMSCAFVGITFRPYFARRRSTIEKEKKNRAEVAGEKETGMI